MGSTAQPASSYRRFCFCGFFALYAGIMMFSFSYWQHFFAIAYMQPLAIVAAAALNLTGVPAEVDLSTIYLGFCTIYMPGVNFRVIHECTGIFTLVIYIATVIAFPASIRHKLGGLLLGVTAFFLYGSMRLTLLGILAELYPSSIQYFHQGIMILANIGFSTFVMLLWLDRTQKKPSPP